MSRIKSPDTARRIMDRYAVCRWIPVSAAALSAGVCENTIRTWADAGIIVSRRTPGGHRRIDRESLVPMDQDEAIALEIVGCLEH